MFQAIIYKFATQIKAVAPLVNTNYIIKSGKYVIPAPPKRAISAYFIFANQMRSKLPGNVTQSSKIIGEEWKKLTEQQKLQYTNKAAAIKAQHDKELDAYRQLYQKPFKNMTISLHSYMMQKVFSGQNKPKSIPEGAAIIKQQIAKLTPEQKTKIEEEIKLKREQVLKGVEKFKMPILEYDTQRKYLLAHCKEKKISELTEHQREKLQKDYKKLTENHQAELRNFALKLNLTLVEFQGLLTKLNRKQNRQKLKVKRQKQQLLAKDVNKVIQVMQSQGKIKKGLMGQIKKKLQSTEPAAKKVAKKPSKPKAQATRTKKAATKPKKAASKADKPETKATTQPVASGSEAIKPEAVKPETVKPETTAQKVAA